MRSTTLHPCYLFLMVFVICAIPKLFFCQNTWVEWENESTTWLSGVSDNSHEKDIAIGDLNNDGFTDIIVAQKAPFSNAGPRADMLLMNNGSTLEDQTATFAPEFITNPSDARDLFIGDFDGDGWDDVVIANTFGDQPIFYHNLGEDNGGNWLGLADESSSRFPLPINVSILQFCSLWAGDIDNNGSLDLYFSNYGQNSGQGTVQDILLINDGNGFFTDESQARLGNLRNSAFGTSVEIHDMDGDDDLDIVKISTLYNVPPWNSRGVFLLFNDGAGNFTNWQNLTPAAAPYMLTIDDFDDNGLKDLYVVDDNSDYVLTANFAIPNISVNYSSQTSPDPRTVFFGGNCKLGDIDKDGDMDFGIAGVDVDIPPCQITGIRQFTMDRNDNGSISAPYGAVNYPWNVSVYDFAFINLNDDCFPDLFLGLCDEFIVFINQSENEPIQISGDTLICGGVSTTLSAPSGYTSYAWSNGGNNQNISVDQEGTYCVTVTKNNGCTIEDCVFVDEQSELYVEISGNNFLCFDGPPETMLIADPGFASYAWSTNENTQSIYVATSGFYCVTVTDNNGCQGDTCTEIIQYPELFVNITGESSVCNGETTFLTASDGFQSYLWDNSEVDQSIVAFPGTYCVTVTDINGCTASTCETVVELPEIVVNISGNSAFCYGESETIMADPGFASYQWSNNETTQNIDISNGGNYCVTVTDDDGCTASGCFTINEYPEVTVEISGNDQFCFGEMETLTAEIGFASYLWSTNETTQSVDVSIPGEYCVTVSDDFGCEGATCFTITENPELFVTITGESTFCSGESSELVATGGFAAYDWSTSETDSILVVDQDGVYCITVTDLSGCTTEDCFSVDASPLATTSIVETICLGDMLEIAGELFSEAGQYQITLPDATVFGCDSIINLNLSINPEILLSNSIVTKDGGNNTGSIEIEPGGGTPPYEIEWNNGESGAIIQNLGFGDYIATITDSEGCTESFSFTVELETALRNYQNDALIFTVSPNPFSTNTQLSYGLQSYSQVRIDVLNVTGLFIENIFSGNQIPGVYTFEWNAENQPEGVYYLKITINGKIYVKKIVLAR